MSSSKTVTAARNRYQSALFTEKQAARRLRQHMRNLDLERIGEDAILPVLRENLQVAAANLYSARIALGAVERVQPL